MMRAFLLSIGQLGDRAVLTVLAKSLLLTLAIFAMLAAALVFGVRALAGGWFGWSGGSADLAGAAALLVAFVGMWLLFRAVAVAVIGIFADDVVAAVEAKHYPQAIATAREVPLSRSVSMGLGSASRAILVNLLLLPLYLILLVTGVGTAALFFVANGWLLGRDLSDMVAARHMNTGEMKAARGTGRGRRMMLGLGGTGLLVIPGVNFVAPVLGAAMATHLYHREKATHA